MNAKQARFVAEYLKDLNATAAATRAGYHPKMAAQLLANPSVSAAVAEKTQIQLDKIDVTAERVKARLAALAFVDPRKFYDAATGKLIPITQLDGDTAASIAQFETIIKNAEAGDGHMDTVHKIRLTDSTKALEMLAKHFGLLIERVEHSGGLELHWGGDSEPTKTGA